MPGEDEKRRQPRNNTQHTEALPRTSGARVPELLRPAESDAAWAHAAPAKFSTALRSNHRKNNPIPNRLCDGPGGVPRKLSRAQNSVSDYHHKRRCTLKQPLCETPKQTNTWQTARCLRDSGSCAKRGLNSFVQWECTAHGRLFIFPLGSTKSHQSASPRTRAPSSLTHAPCNTDRATPRAVRATRGDSVHLSGGPNGASLGQSPCTPSLQR